VPDLTVAVVVASKNRAIKLARLLDALGQQTRRPDQVIVVDDGSDDGTAAMLAARPEPLIVTRLPTSLGPAAARNRGYALASADVIAFTDDDCQPAVDWLARIEAGILAGAGILLGRTTAEEGAWEGRGTWDHWMVTDGADPMFSTCNIGYRRDLLERLGGFDETFTSTRGGAQWGEDTDLGWRAVEQGAHLVYDPDCVVQHDVVPRGWRGYCVAGLRRQGIPRLVKKHPGYRVHLEANVFLNQAHGWAPLVLVGVGAGAAVASVSPLAGVALAGLSAVPYVHFRTRVWPVPTRRRKLLYVLPMLWVADLLETTFVVVAAGKNRVLVV
jgi:glycosyltransferase involved in cell wall biosynthesis